jgi:hypothetical protein
MMSWCPYYGKRHAVQGIVWDNGLVFVVPESGEFEEADI